MSKPKANLREIWSLHLKIGKYRIFIGLGEIQLRRSQMLQKTVIDEVRTESPVT